MKIEIGESLTYSYLKHIEGCRIVQTNWKTSGNWVTTEFEKDKNYECINNNVFVCMPFKIVWPHNCCTLKG